MLATFQDAQNDLADLTSSLGTLAFTAIQTREEATRVMLPPP